MKGEVLTGVVVGVVRLLKYGSRAQLQAVVKLCDKVPDEAVTYNISNDLGITLREQGKYEEAKVFYLAALEKKWGVLGKEHNKKTLTSLYNMGTLLLLMKDYEGALDYYQQALRVLEKVLGKNHPKTLATIMNMATVYMQGLRV